MASDSSASYGVTALYPQLRPLAHLRQHGGASGAAVRPLTQKSDVDLRSTSVEVLQAMSRSACTPAAAEPGR